MKKLLSIMLAVLMLAMGTIAFADIYEYQPGAFNGTAYLKYLGEAPTIKVALEWRDMTYTYDSATRVLSKDTDANQLVYVTNEGVAVDLTFDLTLHEDFVNILEANPHFAENNTFPEDWGEIIEDGSSARLNAPFDGEDENGDPWYICPAITFNADFAVKEDQELSPSLFTFDGGVENESDVRDLAYITITIAVAE